VPGLILCSLFSQLLACAAASSANSVVSVSATPTVDPTHEVLLAAPPDNWVETYRFNHNGRKIAEFTPTAEESVNWQNKLSFESFVSPGEIDPIELLLYEVEQYRERCRFIQHFNLFSGYENGFPTSLHLILCGAFKSIAKGEVSMFKAIRGPDNMYVVKRSRRMAPFKVNEAEVPDMPAWSIHMKRIKLCLKNDPSHPCPPPQS